MTPGSRRLLLLASVFSLSALAADTLDTRAAELARLRGESERLAADVQLQKEDLRGRLRAIDAQKVEIEVQIRREELRLAQIEGEAAGRKAELALHNTSSAGLVPAVTQAIAGVRASVASGLPFRTADRLAELDQLQAQLDGGLVTPESAAARLWAFVEDELRLSRENALDRQVIPLPEGEVLAEVARLGMVALYFRTDGGLTGAAVPRDGGYAWEVITDRDDQKAVAALFEKLRHGVRTGAFTLPNPGLRGAP